MLNCGFSHLRYRTVVPAAVSTLALLVSGCMVGPNYHKPAAPVPPAFQEPTAPAPAGPNAIAYSDWWKVFHDPTLDSLETQAAAANRDIKIAIAHVDEASAATNIAHSYLLPTVGAGPNVSRNREAQNRPNNGNTQGKAATYTDIQLPLFASYEIDAWGRIRRSVQSARATQEATVADLRFVRLSVEASVAIDYYQLRETDQELEILDRTLTDFTRALALTTDRFKNGLNSELEVEQAKTLLDQTVTQKQALQIQRAQLEHALAVLLGRTVEGFSLPDQPSNPTPPVIPSWAAVGFVGEKTGHRRSGPQCRGRNRGNRGRQGCILSATVPHRSGGLREQQCGQPAELAKYHRVSGRFGSGAHFHWRQVAGRCRPGTGGLSTVPRRVRKDCPGGLPGGRGSIGSVALPGG